MVADPMQNSASGRTRQRGDIKHAVELALQTWPERMRGARLVSWQHCQQQVEGMLWRS